MGEEKFYALLQSKFKFPVYKDTKVPNNENLSRLMASQGLRVKSDDKEFKASDLYKSFKTFNN